MERFSGHWTSRKLALFATLAEGRLKCVDGSGAGDQEQIDLRATDVDPI